MSSHGYRPLNLKKAVRGLVDMAELTHVNLSRSTPHRRADATTTTTSSDTGTTTITTITTAGATITNNIPNIITAITSALKDATTTAGAT